MKREIKFRAWDEVKGIMFNWDEISIDNYGVYTPNTYEADNNADNDADSILNKDIILMQYMGLKDRNGKEIYDGDIVIGISGTCRNEERYITIFVAEWNLLQEGRFGDYSDGSGEFNSYLKLEVIGNIYENEVLDFPSKNELRRY